MRRECIAPSSQDFILESLMFSVVDSILWKEEDADSENVGPMVYKSEQESPKC